MVESPRDAMAIRPRDAIAIRTSAQSIPNSQLIPHQGAALLGAPIQKRLPQERNTGNYVINFSQLKASGIQDNSVPLVASTNLFSIYPSHPQNSALLPAPIPLDRSQLINSQANPSPSTTAQLINSQANNFQENTSPSSFAIKLDIGNVKRLVAQSRAGERQEFELTIPESETPATPGEDGREEIQNNSQEKPESDTTKPETDTTITGVIELTADRQEYDDKRKVVTAQGNVVLRFRGALLNADRVQVNLPNRILVADGNVTLKRGDQILRGERFEYSLMQDSGVVSSAKGEVYVPTAGTDLTIAPSPINPAAKEEQRIGSDRITSDRPLQDISNPGSYTFFVGSSLKIDPQTGFIASRRGAFDSEGTINRFRYEAEKIDFEGTNAVGTNVRLTNDPFSPPELELRANTVRFRRLSPLVDEIVATKPRLVFDGGFSIPTFRNRILIDRRERQPALFNIGFDDEQRGGLFIERVFEVIDTPAVRLRVTPQYFIQKAIFDEGAIDPSVFGLKAKLDVLLTPRTILTGNAVFTSLDPDELSEQLRASLRMRQVIGTKYPHNLNLEYSYRDRLFNGSLGFQTVRSSLGAIITSPVIPLGKTGINLSYQGGIQNIIADTDRLDLLDPIRNHNRINLTRYQGSATLSRSFLLWQGKPLPPTPTEGLRYTPAPVVPYLALTGVITGVASAYSNGDTQESISGTIGLSGQLGHFSKPFLDYTGFNIGYTQVGFANLSPFLFDRVADSKVLSFGITQQVYGPFRLGLQTAYNLDTGENISTDFLLEYSRRSYNIVLRFNPVQQLGSISFRINDFNWSGNPGVFDSRENRPVIQGQTRE
ncbi:MAG TPA: DUF3769 domain-containing protein [Cyanobacteria bacterium UBA11149]|nr:DUF3769 domain-containing protein [Cyanobacteria bacterium UBA11367]HBE56839.1 DUF3769 domain-containing protein [Cyanobacteria bacterium UBA11366]HBK62649.1 DUF3769 domain-containing protein [Cyanobacteria bacterium UBA11166]HBR72171.1 DUF3769 domain-containing protein [Cyanobacteria bacterium UBA11159]HBS71009.1 DUF3769 domain-containing protein [Cyanobacteria bacterium UBA11153]HBW89405.1 DUF3769 domain-containing protein [Cyanobacteria bacterium UBA11149]HCA98004.1 DUF3769 domain-conta